MKHLVAILCLAGACAIVMSAARRQAPSRAFAQQTPASATQPATSSSPSTRPAGARAAASRPTATRPFLPGPAYPLSPGVVYTKENAPADPKADDLPRKESVSQYGITWTFDQAVPVGQFINGDWYVVGPATIVAIDPKPLWGDEVGPTIHKEGLKEANYVGRQARNGSTRNPPVIKKNAFGYYGAGFDSRIPHFRYDPDQFTPLPIRMKAGDALVSTISRRNDEITRFSGQDVNPLRVAAVLTCLAEPVPADAFRPSYCRSSTSRVYLARDLRRDLLAGVARPRGAPADLSAYARFFQKPWLDIVWYGFAAPVENLPNYGQQIADRVGEATLLLQADYEPLAREPLLVNVVQVGIDLWGALRAGHDWPAIGGLHSGRKWPIVFAGLMLDDADMQSPNTVYPKAHFQEDDQTALCPYVYKGKTYDRGWTGATAIFTCHNVDALIQGIWDGGSGPVDLFPPSQWPMPKAGVSPASEAYRRLNVSGAWVGEALAARMMHAERAWGHDAFFAYVDRWMTEDDTPFVEQIRKAGGEDYAARGKLGEFGRQQYVSSERFVRRMWDKHRNHLPPAPDASQTPDADKTWKRDF
jgi:hypothetical protein